MVRGEKVEGRAQASHRGKLIGSYWGPPNSHLGIYRVHEFTEESESGEID